MAVTSQAEQTALWFTVAWTPPLLQSWQIRPLPLAWFGSVYLTCVTIPLYTAGKRRYSGVQYHFLIIRGFCPLSQDQAELEYCGAPDEDDTAVFIHIKFSKHEIQWLQLVPISSKWVTYTYFCSRLNYHGGHEHEHEPWGCSHAYMELSDVIKHCAGVWKCLINTPLCLWCVCVCAPRRQRSQQWRQRSPRPWSVH